MAIRLVLAEDNVLVREGARTLIDLEDDLDLVGVGEDLDGLLRLVEAEQPDVVLTDIRMPPSGSDEGVQAARQLRQTHPQIGVVVLSHYLEPAYALAVFAEGAAGRGYLLKERLSNMGQLASAIREVARGGSVIDPKVVDALMAARLADRSPLATLTPRERETLAEMAQGKTNAAIGEALVLSDRAVEKHINAVFTKLDLGPETDGHRRVKAVLLYLADSGRLGEGGDVTVRIVIVDDQPPFREAARLVVDLLDDFDVVGEATSGEEALAVVEALSPDLVLMDINLPGMSGVEATRRLRAAHPDVVTVLVSTYEVEDLPRGADSSGALAYVHKEHLDADLVEQLWHDRDVAMWRTA